MDKRGLNDAVLMEILREHKTITGFLDVVFGFLRRNTDFYHIKNNESETIGFSKGVREQLIYQAMQRYDPDCRLNGMVTQDGIVPHAVKEIELMTQEVSPVPKVSKENNNESFVAADYKNGSLCGNYCWSQTLQDVEVQVKLPANLNCARLLRIEIKPDSISVESRNQPPVCVLSGQLSKKYKYNDAVWSITDGKLLLSFDKANECWWDKLFVTDNCIDLRKIDCERYIDELPEKSQATIQKLRQEQMLQDEITELHQNKDNETQTMERLRKAWNAEGSPFKGQPFDPAMVKFT